MSDTTYKKKLIEVALPLEEINEACKADKGKNIGTLRNLHKWFAPMPQPAWRALLFAALMDDPESEVLRAELLDVIKGLVENGSDNPSEGQVERARIFLQKQFPDGLPLVIDPFVGGGSTLVEASRLGLPTFGSDLNPVPTLISRTLVETMPRVWNRPSLHGGRGSDSDGGLFKRAPTTSEAGLDGLKADVRYYAAAIDEAVRARMTGRFPSEPGESPIAWMWARTARCVNPVCGAETVLTTSWWLSKKPGALAWILPKVEGKSVVLEVVDGQRSGEPPSPPKVGRGADFKCIACDAVLDSTELRRQASTGGIGHRMTAVIAVDGRGNRIYRAATKEDVAAATGIEVDRSGLEVPLTDDPRSIWCVPYGIKTQADFYNDRQLLTLRAFADEVTNVFDKVVVDGGDEEWATAVSTVLGLVLGKLAQVNSAQARIEVCKGPTRFHSTFGRNDLPMIWDYFEAGGLSRDGGPSWLRLVDTALSGWSSLVPASGPGLVVRADARTTSPPEKGLVATDPPYFDAIGYADLSDYFYVWHRMALRQIHPDLYGTVATPKAGELTALSVHHENSKELAREYFIDGFTETFHNLQKVMRPDLPMLVIYASKEQSASKGEETRWSSILTAMVGAGLEITGTWPVHGTGSRRLVGYGTNAVATYIVMVCRPRDPAADTCSLSEFNRALRRELGSAVRELQAASILPVDLSQAAMGPGMQIYSRYRAVLDQAGKRVPVEHALRLINAALAEILDEQEGELDAESRFAVRWWEAHGWAQADFGEADKAARPLGISVDHVKRAQVATAVGNKVQLLGITDMDRSWTPSADIKPTAWEAVHHLADRLIEGGGELEAARLMAQLGHLQDPAMALTYRLHDIAARKSRASDQERYNALINSWSELIRLAGDGRTAAEGLF